MAEKLTLPFKCLSDPTRREILHLLQSGDLTAGEIADHFQMTKPSISHHLKLLKQAGLIVGERDGQHIIYSLETTVLQDLMRWLIDLAPEVNADGEEKDYERS